MPRSRLKIVEVDTQSYYSKTTPLMESLAAQSNQQRLKDGAAILSFVWFQIAQRTVETAIRVYECTPEQAVALRKVFLRPGDYTVSY